MLHVTSSITTAAAGWPDSGLESSALPLYTGERMDREKRRYASALRESAGAMRSLGTSIPPRSHRRHAWRRFQVALAWIAASVVALASLAIGAAAIVVRHYEAGLPSVGDLKAYHAPQVTRILARDGTTVLAELYTQRRTVVSIESLPAHVKLAALAAEDADFYEHEGLNYLGIARALLINLRARSTRQGGLTITQQVVKNLLLGTSERTLARKIREALLARRLERELSKDDILDLYLKKYSFRSRAVRHRRGSKGRLWEKRAFADHR